jgi:putative PIN family toxin of toxin-antitoxin system
MPPKAVIDTNEGIRAAARDSNPVRQALTQEKFEWVTSEPLLTELAEVASRPRMQKYLPPERAGAFIRLLRRIAIIVKPAEDTPACRDPDDAPLIGTAIAGQSNYLVTSDSDLLDDPALQEALANRGTLVVTATRFLSEIEHKPDNADVD